MAGELDRQLFPDFIQTTFAISLGAAFKSIEMMKNPQESVNKVLSETKTLFSIPSDADPGVKGKAQAVMAVWMEKSATWMEACKSAGQRFTDAS